MQDENKTPLDTESPLIPAPIGNPPASLQSTPTPAIGVPAAQPLPQESPRPSSNRSKILFLDRIKLKLDNVLELLFRFGLATVFLINAWTALARPDSFLNLIQNNFAARLVGHYSIQVYAIALNDALLGALILFGIKKKYIYAWAGTWLMIVAFFKVTSLI